MTDKDRPLTPQQEAFVEAYLCYNSKMKALVMAGYSADSKTAWRLMQDSRIQAAIAEKTDEKLNEIKASHTELLQTQRELLKEARAEKQLMAAAKIHETLVKLSGYGKLLSDHLEIEDNRVDLRAVMEDARKRSPLYEKPIDADFSMVEKEEASESRGLTAEDLLS